MKAKKTNIEILEILHKNQLHDWDGTYINAHTGLNCKCKMCNSACHPSFSSLQQGQGGCNTCGKIKGQEKRKNTTQEIQNILEKNDLYVWDGIYINNSTPLNCKCKICNKECRPQFKNLLQGKGGCIECGIKKAANNRKYTIKEIKLTLEENSLYEWDEKYVDCDTPLNCKCRICNYMSHPRYSGLLRGNRGCEKCEQLKREQTCFDRFGVRYPMQNIEIAIKSARNQTISTTLTHWLSKEDIICQASYEVKVVDGYFNPKHIVYNWKPKIFIMPDGRTYMPDCYLPDSDIWIEIKGYFRKDAEEKWNWFHAQYPNSELWNEEKLIDLGILKSRTKDITDTTFIVESSGDDDDII